MIILTIHGWISWKINLIFMLFIWPLLEWWRLNSFFFFLTEPNLKGEYLSSKFREFLSQQITIPQLLWSLYTRINGVSERNIDICFIQLDNLLDLSHVPLFDLLNSTLSSPCTPFERLFHWTLFSSSGVWVYLFFSFTEIGMIRNFSTGSICVYL